MNARHHRLPVIALLALAAVFAFGACSAGTAAGPDGAPSSEVPGAESPAPTTAPADDWAVDPDPESSLTACDVITKADVDKVFGVEADPTPNVSDAKGISDCRYDAVGLVVTVDTARGDRRFDAARKTYGDATDVPGIGDGAFYSEKESAFVVVHSRTSVFLRLRSEDRAEQWKQLAALALLKL